MKKLWKFSALAATAALPVVAVSCGNTVDTIAKLQQDELLKKAEVATLIEQNWLKGLIQELYKPTNTTMTQAELNEAFEVEPEKYSETLFNDAYKAFRFYAEKQLATNTYFFQELNNTLISKGNVNPTDASTLADKTQSLLTPSENVFRIYWKTPESNVRFEILKMLAVYKYFSVSDLETLNKMSKDTEKITWVVTASPKYSLTNYFLNKYALTKRMVQIWEKTTTDPGTPDDFFIQKTGNISGPVTFNEYFKDTDAYQKQLTPQSVNLLVSDSSAPDTKLVGYVGFRTNVSDYGLNWDYEQLKNVTADSQNKAFLTRGYYDPNRSTLIQISNDPDKGYTSYNPYVKDKTTNTTTVKIAYLNQIVPLAGVEQAPKTSEENAELGDVTVLSFANTIFKDQIDKLSYIYYQNDDALFKTAQEAFVRLGYKIHIKENVIGTLPEEVKTAPYVEIDKE
ncbi:HinT-interacting membrane complex lipoprotein P60 [Mycoplasmopsis columbinasalis]|uniref:P60-like lipoprotein n=1 Tax=Mycoplasmopsis columbinasalis TaxID=114880 RepID=A0A449BAQ5_9BACT|nr:hypothetical protein [Mycoplasmopsis columbinasalis]VEU78281.1 Uncharacterised protein [Mycoplasmopsis columbinasalis]